MLGLLYDIHGNIPALEQVLEQAEAEGVDRWLLGGDYGTPSPWPLETLDRLKQLPNATWIRGNGERWLREPPLDRPEVMESYAIFSGHLPDEVVDWLYALPPQAELDGVLYVHGSPLSDVESFKAAGRSRRRAPAGRRARPRRSSSGTAICSSAGPGRPASSCSTPAASACRSTATRAPPGRCAPTTASSSSGEPRTTTSEPPTPTASSAASFGEFAARRLERGSD